MQCVSVTEVCVCIDVHECDYYITLCTQLPVTVQVMKYIRTYIVTHMVVDTLHTYT